MMATSCWSERRLFRMMALEFTGARREVAVAQGLDGRERGRGGDRISAVGAAQSAFVHLVHHLGPTGDRGERHAAREAFGRGDQVGDDALVVDGEPVTGATEAALYLVGDEERRRWRVVHSDKAGRKPSAGTMKPPSPWMGSIKIAATLWSAHLGLDGLDGARGRLGAGQSVVERVAHGDPVDLGREGAEAVLVGHVLCREGHGQVGTPVVRVVKDDDGLSCPWRDARS